jgi:hypothetical protein
VIDETIQSHQSNAYVAYVYFDYKNAEAQTEDFVVRTLLKQLLFSVDLIPRELENVYDERCSRLKSPDNEFLISQLLSTATKISNVFIMLDALDECSNETLEDMITLIHRFKHSGIKVLCTFRPILINLRDRLAVSDIYDISAHEEDVRNYLSIRLNKEWLHNKIFIPRIIDRLAQDVEGKFVYILFSH